MPQVGIFLSEFIDFKSQSSSDDAMRDIFSQISKTREDAEAAGTSPCVVLSAFGLRVPLKPGWGEKTQLEQVVMEAMALHYSELSLRP